MNIGTLPARHARDRPDHLALVTESERLTFAAFEQRIGRLAAALQAMGAGRGDKIATVLPNGPAIYETDWAVARIGAATVPLSPLLRGEGLATPLRDSDASIVIAAAAQADDLAQIAFLEEFARSTAGTILKRVLRAPYWAGRSGQI